VGVSKKKARTTMTTYPAFVKANISKMPGATPRERMRQVAQKWRDLPSLQKTSSARPHTAGKVMEGKGFLTDFIKGASSILSFVPGPVGAVAKVVNIGAHMFGGAVTRMSPAQIRTIAKQMHGGQLFATKQAAFEEGKRLAEQLVRR